MVLGFVAIAGLFGAMGLAVVVLGRKGKQGHVDYAMGAHSREDFEPETWKEAHELAGASMMFGGGLFVLGAVLFLATALAGLPEWIIAIALLIPALIATVAILAGAVRGAARLSASKSAPAG